MTTALQHADKRYLACLFREAETLEQQRQLALLILLLRQERRAGSRDTPQQIHARWRAAITRAARYPLPCTVDGYCL